MSSFTKAQGSKIAIKFTDDLIGDVSDNVSAFTVTGQERKHVTGPLINGDYQIDSISKGDTDDIIILEMKLLKRFPSVEGKLEINYDASKGDLEGEGGVVETFEVDFLPEDLVAEPHPYFKDTVIVEPIVAVDLKWITYHDAYDNEEENAVTVAPASVAIVLTDVSIVDP